MARVYVNNTWHEQVEPSTFSEAEFELRVNLHAPSIYPHYFVSAFKRRLAYPDASEDTGFSYVVPDLIFISKEYDEWWLVELEMIYHSLDSHVIPQIQSLQMAIFDDKDVNYVCEKNARVDKDKLLDLVNQKPRGILVIANANNNDWRKKINRFGASLASFELFRSSDGNELFRVDGEYPSIIKRKICDCPAHPDIPTLIKITDPSCLPIEKDRVINLIFNNCVTHWRRIEDQDDVFLMAANRNPLKPSHKYALYLQNDGQLVLRRETTPRSGG